MKLYLKPKYYECGKLFSIYIFLAFSIYYLVLSTLPSGEQVLYIKLFILRKCISNLTLLLCIWKYDWKYNFRASRFFEFPVRQPLWKFNCRAFRFFKYVARLPYMPTRRCNSNCYDEQDKYHPRFIIYWKLS